MGVGWREAAGTALSWRWLTCVGLAVCVAHLMGRAFGTTTWWVLVLCFVLGWSASWFGDRWERVHRRRAAQR